MEGIKIVIGEMPEDISTEQLGQIIAETLEKAMGHKRKKARKADMRRRGQIVFGMTDERSQEIYEALHNWAVETEEYHSVELYEYAVTLAKNDSELFFIGVTCGDIVAKTAVN